MFNVCKYLNFLIENYKYVCNISINENVTPGFLIRFEYCAILVTDLAYLIKCVCSNIIMHIMHGFM